MALDPRIAMGVNPLQLKSPIEQQMQVLQLRDLQRQAAQPQQIEQAKAQLLAVVQKHGGLNEQSLAEIETTIDPALAMKLRQAQAEMQPKAAPQQGLMNVGGRVFDPATRQVVYEPPPAEQAQRPPEDVVQTVGPDGQPVFTPKSQAPGQKPYVAPPTPRAVGAPVKVRGPNGRAQFVTPEMAIGMQPWEEPKTAASAAPEQLEAVMDEKTGKPVLVPRSQAAGRTPAGGTGGANRKLTVGAADSISTFDTSLDDVNVLERDLGKTGAASKVGAMLPNVVTEMTGWGADAKSRQAVIDRVKQVIGKALEGGVLRKEDELKYVKILPTIGDPPSVAKDKINGLRAAITQRRTRALESYADAGYDVSNYQQDAPRGTTTTPKKVGRFEIVGVK